MIIDHGKLRLAELTADVQEYNEMGIPAIQKLRGKLTSIKAELNDLVSQLKNYKFNDPQEEIFFFKTLKPQFNAIYIYELEIFKIETGRPVGEEFIVKAYYEQELKYLRSFLEKHQFLYQYYLMDGNELDIAYFTREGRIGSPVIEEPIDMDYDNATVGEYLFSKFIAYQKIQEQLLQMLYAPPGIGKAPDATVANAVMRWTGDKANLIELAYGIWLTGQLNEGNASLNEIIKWLENNFEVKLGNFRKRFSEIESRKRLSITKFLDQMKEATLKKMEDNLE